MAEPQLTIHEVAERIGVGASTLRTWGEKLGVAGVRSSSGKRLYSDDDVAMLEVIKQLRDGDAGFTTIRRRIGLDTVPDGEASVPHGGGTVGQEVPTAEPPPGHGGGTAPPVDTPALIAQVVEAIGDQTELAEKYARAAHTIGQLEERVANLTSQLGEARALLTTGDGEHQAARDRLVGELAEARMRIGQLEAATARPWWRFWG